MPSSVCFIILLDRYWRPLDIVLQILMIRCPDADFQCLFESLYELREIITGHFYILVWLHRVASFWALTILIAVLNRSKMYLCIQVFLDRHQFSSHKGIAWFFLNFPLNNDVFVILYDFDFGPVAFWFEQSIPICWEIFPPFQILPFQDANFEL